MKKFILLVVIFIVATFFVIGNKKEIDAEKKNISIVDKKEIRAVYISYIELDDYIKEKDEKTSKNNIISMIKNVKDNNFNTIILHVRPFSDAIYRSLIFPISNSVLNNENKAPNYDVLNFFIKEAHKNNISLHAWINPYRISHNTDIKRISKKSPAYKFINTSNIKVIKGKGIFYNPASVEVRNLIIKGIKELVENYDIDGVHFDDYFYPDKTIDLDSYQVYLAAGGNMSLDEYRLDNVTNLIKDIYSEIKSIKKNVKFGIAPEGNIDNNYSINYIDTKKILANSGYVDYIMPQVYFGFLNETRPFLDTVAMWNDLIKIDNITLIPALALYKSGTKDIYAKGGINEWVQRSDIIKRQVLVSRNLNKYGGFSIFSYNYLFNKNKLNKSLIEEFDNLVDILK